MLHQLLPESSGGAKGLLWLVAAITASAAFSTGWLGRTVRVQSAAPTGVTVLLACDTDFVDVLDLSGVCRDHAAAVPAAED